MPTKPCRPCGSPLLAVIQPVVPVVYPTNIPQTAMGAGVPLPHPRLSPGFSSQRLWGTRHGLSRAWELCGTGMFN